MNGNISEELLLQRQYSRLSNKASFSRGDSSPQGMAIEDENENKVQPKSDPEFQKLNGSSRMDHELSREYGQGTPFLVTEDANRSGVANGTNKQAAEEDERSSNRSGSLQNLVSSGSGSDRETIVWGARSVFFSSE